MWNLKQNVYKAPYIFLSKKQSNNAGLMKAGIEFLSYLGDQVIVEKISCIAEFQQPGEILDLGLSLSNKDLVKMIGWISKEYTTPQKKSY